MGKSITDFQSKITSLLLELFRKQMYRIVELDKLLDMKLDKVVNMMNSRQLRRFRTGFVEGKKDRLIKKLRITMRDSVAKEKSFSEKIYLRNFIIVSDI